MQAGRVTSFSTLLPNPRWFKAGMGPYRGDRLPDAETGPLLLDAFTIVISISVSQ
jgi:hypothetical protein